MLVTIKTDREYSREDIGEILKYFMYLDLHTFIVFKRDLTLLDNYIGRYSIVNRFTSQGA